jgi:hypothetical protein
MKFLTINTDYPEFLIWLYSQNKGLEEASYQEQLRLRMASLFSENDFYSKNLIRLGHEAWDIHANNEHMQKAWAREHGFVIGDKDSLSGLAGKALYRGARMADRTPLKRFKSLYSNLVDEMNGKPGWFYPILAAQIEYYRPDVIYNHAISDVDNTFFKKCRSGYKLLVGQHAATPISPQVDFSAYDLFISSFPPTVEYFRRRGIPAEYNRLGFEPAVLSSLAHGPKKYDLTFIGSLHPIHSTRITLLEALCDRFPQLKIWGPGIDNLAADSPLKKHYMGQAWGRDMYQILHDSRITINHHGNIPPYANNLRLYEATGTGALLITDWKENLSDIFEIGKEIVAYKNVEECEEKISYYLENADEREIISRAGQDKTLKEHNYFNCMSQMTGILEKYVQPHDETGARHV